MEDRRDRRRSVGCRRLYKDQYLVSSVKVFGESLTQDAVSNGKSLEAVEADRGIPRANESAFEYLDVEEVLTKKMLHGHCSSSWKEHRRQEMSLHRNELQGEHRCSMQDCREQ
jgi:hypothetical protein